MSARIYCNFSPVASLIDRGRIGTAEEIVRVVEEAGLDGLEISGHVLESADRLPFPFSLADLQGLPLSFHSNYIDFNLGSVNGFVRRAGIEQLKSELALAGEWGLSPVTIHPGWVRKTDRKTALSVFWAALDEVLGSVSLSSTVLCLENMDHRPEKLCNLEEEIAETLDRFPPLRLTVDLAHLGLRGADIAGFLAAFGERIAHAHVSGVAPDRPHGQVSLAESRIDLRPHLAGLKDRDIAFVIENSPWETMLESRDLLLEVLR